jgi:hypothetical protein
MKIVGFKVYGEWEPIPRWHPRRWWSKYDMRRRVLLLIVNAAPDYYEYGRYQDIARDALQELYAPDGGPRRGE